MTYKTMETTLQPDGRVVLSREELPDHPLRVMITFLEADEAARLLEVGDYGEHLLDYEERLARGEIRWQ